MPSRNTVKEYSPDSYCHIYNRGVAKQLIFIDSADKKKFLSIIARHLDPANNELRHDGVAYKKHFKELELLCFCLMNNHFHLLIYVNNEPRTLKEFMQSISTAYSMYFNKKYNRVGTLFQGVYKASRISNDSYLTHISRYIHLNPRNYRGYRYSSLRYYFIDKNDVPIWLKPDIISSLFKDGQDYEEFLADYEDNAAMIATLKDELADGITIFPAKRYRNTYISY